MIIQIEGMNRTEFCKPKRKDIDRRRFFETRGMLYRAYPDQLTKVRIREFGVQVGMDEMIIYQENSIHPQIERGTRITMDKILADIDNHKNMVGSSMPAKPWAKITSSGSLIGKLAPAIPFVITGIVLVIALVSNGGF